MPYVNSIDKIVTAYFAAINRSSFTYMDKVYPPKNLIVSTLLLRGYTCPEHCGGCCPRFSLDYLPVETRPYDMPFRTVNFNGADIKLYSDLQNDHENHHCKNLIHENGRCGVHGKQPFSCDFELIRAIHHQDRTILTQKLFGRGWAFLRTDGERGARCEMTPVTKETVDDVIRKLNRLKQWAEHFGVDHCLDAVIQWAKSGSGMDLLIPKNKKTGLNVRNIGLEEIEESLIQIKL